MKKIQDTVALLNPGQTLVIAAGQPLYALLKQVQCECPDYGDDKFVIMFGGPNGSTEMTMKTTRRQRMD